MLLLPVFPYTFLGAHEAALFAPELLGATAASCDTRVVVQESLIAPLRINAEGACGEQASCYVLSPSGAVTVRPTFSRTN